MPVVDLTVDRNLLCPNFDGYKLSFDAVPVLRQGFDVNPLKLEPHVNQYSLLHVELFARHNLLVSDPWARYNCYFINARHEVVLCSYNEQQGVARSQRIVYSAHCEDRGDGYTHQVGDYNYSLRFISEKYCVLCDGIVELCLLDTGDRERATPWKLVTRAQIQPDSDDRGFVLYDARLDIVQERKQISLVAGHVARLRGSHTMQLTWSRWSLDAANGTSQWTYQMLQQLESRGSVYYCAFEPRAESLVFCSSGELQTPQQADLAVAEEATRQAEANQADAPPRKSWVQTDEDVMVRLPLPAGVTRNDVSVTCAEGQLRVECQGQTLLEGELFAAVDKDLTSWTLEGQELHLTLYKLSLGKQWTNLLGSEDRESDAEEQLPIPNLEDPIEDCDLPMNANSVDIKMVRFNLAESAITHTIFLGTTPPLFVSCLRPGYPVAFATRQGVDASLWLQLYQPARPQEWSVRHEGNLHAFGYVQASKQQRKFMDCCPYMDYAVITESYRHVFIYKSRYDSAGGLRNRNGPQVVIGKQHLVTLDDDVGEVLGMVTAPNVIVLLTEHAVLYIQI